MTRDLCEDLIRDCYARFGRPDVDFFGDQWRVWWRQWHTHDGACSGDLSGRGATLVRAIECALVAAKRAKVLIPRDQTCRECELNCLD